MASDGVLKPKPTSLYHLLSFVTIFLPPTRHELQYLMQLLGRWLTLDFGILKDVLLLE